MFSFSRNKQNKTSTIKLLAKYYLIILTGNYAS